MISESDDNRPPTTAELQDDLKARPGGPRDELPKEAMTHWIAQRKVYGPDGMIVVETWQPLPPAMTGSKLQRPLEDQAVDAMLADEPEADAPL